MLPFDYHKEFIFKERGFFKYPKIENNPIYGISMIVNNTL